MNRKNSGESGRDNIKYYSVFLGRLGKTTEDPSISSIPAKIRTEYFGFPCQFSIHRLFHTHYLSSRAATVGQLVADMPSGLKSHPTLKKKQPKAAASFRERFKSLVRGTSVLSKCHHELFCALVYEAASIVTYRSISRQLPKYAHSTVEPVSQEVFSTWFPYIHG
jgi:hypothetical protein